MAPNGVTDHGQEFIGVIPSASMTTGDIGIKYMQTVKLSSTFRTTYSIPVTDNQALIFLVNDTVLGVYSGNNLFQERDRPDAARLRNDNNGHATLSTGFGWSTDANGVSTGKTTTGVLWEVEVSQTSTRLWQDLATNVSVTNPNPVYVRVVQLAASTDSWYIDALSLFSDSIVWEFSNNGGQNWVPGYEVANDPDGVVAFNPANPADLTAKANQFCYRVTIWAPGQWVSHLAIRPWYAGYMRGVPARPRGSMHGPNVNPWDHYPPIEADPRWQMWHRPVPRDWWFAYRVPDTTPYFIIPYVTDNVLIPGKVGG